MYNGDRVRNKTVMVVTSQSIFGHNGVLHLSLLPG